MRSDRQYSRGRGEVAHCIPEAKEKEVTDYILEAGEKWHTVFQRQRRKK